MSRLLGIIGRVTNAAEVLCFYSSENTDKQTQTLTLTVADTLTPIKAQ